MFKVKYHKVRIHNQALSLWSPHHEQEEFNVSFHMQKCVEEKPQKIVIISRILNVFIIINLEIYIKLNPRNNVIPYFL